MFTYLKFIPVMKYYIFYAQSELFIVEVLRVKLLFIETQKRLDGK